MDREYVNCDLCGQDKTNDFLSIPELYGGEGMNFVLCRNCGLVYANPRPTLNWLQMFYRAERTSNYFEKYISEHMGQCELLVETISHYVPESSKILDIGSSIGLFLYCAQKRGWQISGIEPNTNEVKFGKEKFGLTTLYEGYLTDTTYSEKSFDVVTLWDVIEHSPSPTKLLFQINHILKPGGILAFTAPNVDSYVAKQRNPVIWEQGHLYFFTEKTLNHLLEKTGFISRNMVTSLYIPIQNTRVKDELKKYCKYLIIGARYLLNSKYSKRILQPSLHQSGFTIIARRN